VHVVHHQDDGAIEVPLREEAVDVVRHRHRPDESRPDAAVGPGPGGASGYERITPLDREKILSLNAARVYGFDLEATRRTVANDDLAWAKEAVAEYRKKTFPALRL
jgi:hypothetical protein